MTSLFSTIGSKVGQALGNWLSPYLGNDIAQGALPVPRENLAYRYSVLRNYYNGDHFKQLKVTANKDGKTQDDNVIQNLIGLAIDRSVSRLYKGGVNFVVPDGATAQQEYLDRVWDLNKKEIIMYQVGLHGAVYGTAYFKINPNKLIDPYTLQPYPQLIPLDPEIIRIQVSPDDMNDVEEYLIQYGGKEIRDGREVEVTHKEITKHADVYNEQMQPAGRAETWVVETYEQVGGGQMTLIAATPWDYDFPPIIHWKNLPSLKSCYGDSDIDDAINVQDKSNFVVSNTGKIIKYHANPTPIGTGFSVKEMERVDWGPGVFTAIPNPEAKVANLEMQSDLASSVAFGDNLRQSIFDIAREIDLSTIADKLGALTNFGLQVLYTDANDKNDTKRQLYGDAFKELNRRLLVLANFAPEASNPGSITWGNPLPLNIREEMEADKLALEMGIVDKQTVSERYTHRYGVDWETIQARLQNEQTQANAANDNIGAAILRNFNTGQPTEIMRERQGANNGR